MINNLVKIVSTLLLMQRCSTSNTDTSYFTGLTIKLPVERGRSCNATIVTVSIRVDFTVNSA
jgi:hypothetical protein